MAFTHIFELTLKTHSSSFRILVSAVHVSLEAVWGAVNDTWLSIMLKNSWQLDEEPNDKTVTDKRSIFPLLDFNGAIYLLFSSIITSLACFLISFKGITVWRWSTSQSTRACVGAISFSLNWVVLSFLFIRNLDKLNHPWSLKYAHCQH